jgi:hypothetical protein
MRPLVYVSGPYTASTSEQLAQNIELAKQAGLKVRAMGLVPIVPHLAILNDDPPVFTYDHAMAECLEILDRCDAVLMMDGWRESHGAQRECSAALRAGILVFFSLAELCQANQGTSLEAKIQ